MILKLFPSILKSVTRRFGIKCERQVSKIRIWQSLKNNFLPASVVKYEPRVNFRLKLYPVLDAIATISPSGKLGLMLIHRSADGRSTELTMDLEGFVAQNDAEIVSSVSETWSDRNRRDIPQKIEPGRSCAEVRDGVHLKLTLPRFNIYVQLTIYLLFTSKSEGYLDEGDTKMEVTVQATEFANIKLF